MAIIIVALVPIFFLERVEGRIFAPMAYTYAFALAGALAPAAQAAPPAGAASALGLSLRGGWMSRVTFCSPSMPTLRLAGAGRRCSCTR